jgi:hypothetical protein
MQKISDFDARQSDSEIGRVNAPLIMKFTHPFQKKMFRSYHCHGIVIFPEPMLQNFLFKPTLN